MERLRTALGWHGLAWGGLWVCIIAATACGEPSCPGGSIEINGRCEPASAQMCKPGEVEDGGACIDASGSADGGRDGEIDLPDATTDAGDQDADGAVTESDDPLCDALECGDNGSCRVVGGAAVCRCDEGYAGERCDECKDDRVLDDGACVNACESSDAPSCGDNGACALVDGAAVCECVHPFDGELCDECAQGFALQPDGTCEPDCGVCDAHSVCNETLMTPACECVAGYADDGDGCEWVGDGTTGGIVDGDLDVPEAWTVQNGMFDEGTFSFNNIVGGDGACKLGSIEQTLHMPAREDAEPLVLDIDARAVCTSTDPGACPPLLVDIGESLTRVTIAGGPAPMNRTLSVCLGSAAYQDEVVLRVRPGLAVSTLSTAVTCTATWPSLQRISIRPANAGECPSDGSLLGSLASEAGWTRRRPAESASAQLSGNKITVTSSTNEMSTLVSVPAEGGLAVRVTSPMPANLAVRFDGLTVANGLPTSPAVICLPEWTFGSVHSVGFSVASGTAEVTQLSVGNDAACTDVDFDAGFERASFNGNGWSTSIATVLQYPDGTRAWRASGSQSGISGVFLMPGYGETSKRPALNLRSRVGSPTTTGRVTVMGGWISTETVVTTSDNWMDTWLCLDEAWLGQPTNVLALASASLSGGTPYVWIDRLTPAVVDPSMCD